MNSGEPASDPTIATNVKLISGMSGRLSKHESRRFTIAEP